MKITAIIQARMGSTRLPGKVMMKIQGKTVLEHVISRVQLSKEIDEIIVATTNKPDDDVIVDEAMRLGVKCFRGPEEDVLSRYYYAAKENNTDVIVRITSDCPLIDPLVIDEMVSEYKMLYKVDKIDYLSNTIKRTYPRGLDVEIVSFKGIEEAFSYADKHYQREHVTPYFHDNPQKFILINYQSKVDYSDYRLTLDTTEDLELITTIYSNLYKNGIDFYLSNIISLFEFNPNLVKINNFIEQKKINR